MRRAVGVFILLDAKEVQKTNYGCNGFAPSFQQSEKRLISHSRPQALKGIRFLNLAAYDSASLLGDHGESARERNALRRIMGELF